MSDECYYQQDSHVRGPVSRAELVKIARIGQITGTCLVAMDRQGQWQLARNIKWLEFAPSLPPTSSRTNASSPESTASVLLPIMVAALSTVALFFFVILLAVIVGVANDGSKVVAEDSSDTVSVEAPVATATWKAWRQMRRTDNELLAASNHGPGFLRHCASRYAAIDTDFADAELRRHIEEYIRLLVEGDDIVVSFVDESNRLNTNSRSVAEFGAALGASDSQNPKVGAALGAWFFGAMAIAANQPELEKISAEYNRRFASVTQRLTALDESRVQLANSLSQRYGVVFD